MFRNIGRKDFFEHGILIDTYHSDTEYDLIRCEPYPDEEDHYQYAKMHVDLESPWIDRRAVLESAGMTEDNYDSEMFAVALTDYYGWGKFGADDYGVFYDWRNMDRASIEKELSHEFIAADVPGRNHADRTSARGQKEKEGNRNTGKNSTAKKDKRKKREIER